MQSSESKIKIFKTFCLLSFILTAVYAVILSILHFYFSSAITFLIALVFTLCMPLYKRSYTFLAGFILVLGSNFCVLYTGLLLGFNSGIYLYLFAAPFILHLLIEKAPTMSIMLIACGFLLTFLILFIIRRFDLVQSIALSEKSVDLFFAINFCVSFILCFCLLVYAKHAKNAETKVLEDENGLLKNKLSLVEKELAGKKDTREELAKVAKEKDTLLSEIHHRVKNNLAIISGLMELQNMYVKDEKASSVLKESRDRIKSIAVVHEKFYESPNIDKVDMRSYIDESIYYMRITFANLKKKIKINLQVDPIEMTLNNALSFSLLLNELITNSYKHAFKDKEAGTIYISFIKSTKGLVFTFKDDGNGFEYTPEVKANSLGLNLIEAFSKQLKGEMRYSSKPGSGTEYYLKFNA